MTLTSGIAVPHFTERLCNIFWHSCCPSLSLFIHIPMPAWMPSPFQSCFGGTAVQTHSCYMQSLYVLLMCGAVWGLTQEKCSFTCFCSQTYFQASLAGVVKTKLHLFSILFFLLYIRLENCHSFCAYVSTLLNCR